MDIQLTLSDSNPHSGKHSSHGHKGQTIQQHAAPASGSGWLTPPVLTISVLIAFLLGIVVANGCMALIKRKRSKSATTVQPPPPVHWPQDLSIEPLPPAKSFFEHKESSQMPLSSSPSTDGMTTVHLGRTSDFSSEVPPAKEESSNNEQWLHLAEECTELFDELEKLAPNVDPPRQEMIRHVKWRLQEILTRSGIDIISSDTTYDRSRHRLEPPSLDVLPGTPIAEVISPGFAVGRRVLRPAHVRVANSASSSLKG